MYKMCFRMLHWTCSCFDYVMLSWFDLLLVCTNHTHIHRDYWRKGKSLKHGSHGTAAAVPLVYTHFVTAHTP